MTPRMYDEIMQEISEYLNKEGDMHVRGEFLQTLRKLGLIPPWGVFLDDDAF